MHRALRAVTGLGGGIAIFAGLVLAVDPGSLADVGVVGALRGVVGELDPTLLMLLAGVVLVTGSLLSLRRRDSAPTLEELWGPRHGDATTGAGERAVVGAEFDRHLDAALAGDDAALATIRDRLRRQAALATGGYGDDEAGAVPPGQWTDDRLAAAFLGDDDGPTPPIGARLRWVLDPVGERRRRVERAIAAIEAAREARP